MVVFTIINEGWEESDGWAAFCQSCRLVDGVHTCIHMERCVAAVTVIIAMTAYWRLRRRRAHTELTPVARNRRMERNGVEASRVFALWKPYMTLCSFLDEADPGARGRDTLDGLNLPQGCLNVGRLDRDSEGLLLLTDDGALCHRVLQGGTSKRYVVMVSGQPTDEAIAGMAAGGLNIRGRVTRPCQVRRLDWDAASASIPGLPPPPAQSCFAHNSTWLEVVLDEGMNRQIRRMTQHAGHKTLRLVRMGIGSLRAESLGLRPGEFVRVAASSDICFSSR